MSDKKPVGRPKKAPHAIDVWLDKVDRSRQWLADRMGIHYSTISLWCLGCEAPSPANLRRLSTITGGAVSASDWSTPSRSRGRPPGRKTRSVAFRATAKDIARMDLASERDGLTRATWLALVVDDALAAHEKRREDSEPTKNRRADPQDRPMARHKRPQSGVAG